MMNVTENSPQDAKAKNIDAEWEYEEGSENDDFNESSDMKETSKVFQFSISVPIVISCEARSEGASYQDLY